MYYLKTEGSFDAAHFLKGYTGTCCNLHGHRWRLVVEIKSETLKEKGQIRSMVVDFADLKQTVKQLCDVMDHSLIYESGSLKDKTVQALQEENFRLMEMPFRPTAEELAKYFYGQVRKEGYTVNRVEVYETPANCAAYEETGSSPDPQ